MDFISVMAVTEAVARERVMIETGYEPGAIGRLLHVAPSGDNSRQNGYLFETDQDVTKHPHYAKARLFDTYELRLFGHTDYVEDGPMLVYGPEVTVGG